MTPPGKVGFKRPGPFKSGGKVGFKRPMPFMHGGKVKMNAGGRVLKMQTGGRLDDIADQLEHERVRRWPFAAEAAGSMKHGGKVRKMQEGGALDLDEVPSDKFRRFFGPKPTPTPTPKPQKKQSGGEVDPSLQSRDREGGPVSPQEQDALFQSEQASNEAARARAMNEQPGQGRKFLNRVKGVASAVAKSEPSEFKRGGKVKMPATQMPPMMPTEAPPPPRMNALNTPNRMSFNPPSGYRGGGRVRKMQDGGMAAGIARSTDAEVANQNRIHMPPRYQFKNGGRLPPDNVPALLGKGEVVLNKNQQKKVVVKPNWQKGLNPKERAAMASMPLPRMRNQRAMNGKTIPRIFGGK